MATQILRGLDFAKLSSLFRLQPLSMTTFYGPRYLRWFEVPAVPKQVTEYVKTAAIVGRVVDFVPARLFIRKEGSNNLFRGEIIIYFEKLLQASIESLIAYVDSMNRKFSGSADNSHWNFQSHICCVAVTALFNL